MHGQEFFTQALIYLTAAVVAVPVARRLGLGSVLGYLAAGMIIGPFGLGLIGEEGQDVMHFAEFGVVMMLFLVGLELQPSLLWRLRTPIVGLGGLQVLVSMLVIAGIALAFGLVWQAALAIGMTLALSSTASALQTLNEKNLTRTDAGQNAFAVLLFQDIAVIPMLALLPLLAHLDLGHQGGHGAAGGGAWIAGLPGWAQTLAVLAAVAVIGLVGRFLARYLFRLIARTRMRELFTAAALLLVIGVALLMTKLGLSPALGTFIAGVVLANNEYRHELEGDIEPFKGLLLAVFFIAVGASVNFALIAAQPGLIAGLVGLLVVAKFVVLLVLGRTFRMGTDQNLLFAFVLAQGGEFAYVLLSFATQNGVVAAATAAPLVAVVALSMALTPLLLTLNEKLLQPRLGTREKVSSRAADAIEVERPVIIAGFGNFGSTVGRLLAASGVKATVLEYDSDRVELLRKLGFEVYYGDASRHDLLCAAGAEHAKIIVLALDDHEKILGMVHTIGKHFPHLVILARAAGRPQAYELVEAGVHHVYRDTLDTSLRTGIDALNLLGHRTFRAHRTASAFRRHDESSLRELAPMRHDQGEYLTLARRRIADLEQLLLADLEDADEQRDAGWDTESLRAEFGGDATATRGT